METKSYIAIDLKSFYASVECTERGLDPLTTNLVVADRSRTEKTICLAVSPSLKSYGIPGRPRLFEVTQRLREVNQQRREHAPGRAFTGKSVDARQLEADPALELDYIVAVPRMAYYMEYSTRIFDIYLKYPRLFHRRSVYGCHFLSEDLSYDGKRAGCHDDPGDFGSYGHHRHGRHRHQSVSLQGGDGYRGQAHGAKRARGADGEPG